MIKRRASLAILIYILLSCVMSTPTAATDTKTDFFRARSGETLSLPHESSHVFSHVQDGSEHAILDSTTLGFCAERDSIVSICFSGGAVAIDGNETKSTVTATVYDDQGNKICEDITDTEANSSHIEFICAYSGVYFLGLESRATVAGEYTCNYSISAKSGYEKKSIDAFPHKAEYNESNHSSVYFSELFPNAKNDSSDKYKVSIFELSHEAGSILHYKIKASDGAPTPSAVLMSYDGNVYTPHTSHACADYSCGDAIELCYTAKSYLFVFSDGNFSLEADLLVHNEYKIKELGSSFSGSLDTSDSVLMYDEEKLSAIKEAFPFTDIKNRNVIFFVFDCAQSSVVSYICDRSEHKFFSIVSDELGLSHNSTYPLREFGGYCSEISPFKYCYDSRISDGSKFYLCYTGTGNGSFVEVQSATTHTTSFIPEEKYKPGDIIPHIQIQNIYSDEQIYKRLGIDESLPDVMRIGGYMMIDEAGTRYYFGSGSDITVPDVDGKIKLYSILECVYNSNSDRESTLHHSLLISEITSDRGFFAPIIESVTEFFEGRVWLAFLLGGVAFAGIGTSVFFTIKHIKKKKAENTEADTEPKTEEEVSKKDETL